MGRILHFLENRFTGLSVQNGVSVGICWGNWGFDSSILGFFEVVFKSFKQKILNQEPCQQGEKKSKLYTPQAKKVTICGVQALVGSLPEMAHGWAGQACQNPRKGP